MIVQSFKKPLLKQFVKPKYLFCAISSFILYWLFVANVSPPGLTIHTVERKDIDHSQEVGRSKYLTQVWSPAYFFCLHIFTLLVCPKDPSSRVRKRYHPIVKRKVKITIQILGISTELVTTPELKSEEEMSTTTEIQMEHCKCKVWVFYANQSSYLSREFTEYRALTWLWPPFSAKLCLFHGFK